jgi:hypothetical protein
MPSGHLLLIPLKLRICDGTGLLDIAVAGFPTEGRHAEHRRADESDPTSLQIRKADGRNSFRILDLLLRTAQHSAAAQRVIGQVEMRISDKHTCRF